MSGGPDLDRLEELIEGRFGLAPSSWQRDRIAATLVREPRSLGREPSGEVLRGLIEQLTVGETYFFREPAQIEALVQRSLPDLAQRVSAGRPLRILSAGCSSGEEAYSIAIALALHAPELGRRCELLGIDVSATAVRRARSARYGAWALRATPPALRDRFFRKEGPDFVLDDAIRTRVRFEEKNLLEEDPAFFVESAFDVILCRNVLIYFSERATRKAVQRFTRLLPPGGYFFLGHSETLRGVSDDFDLIHEDNAFYYRRKSGTRTPLPERPALSEREPAALSAPPPSSFAWADEIQRSSERITELWQARGTSPRKSPPPEAPPDTPSPLSRALLLIEAERFDDALITIAAAGGRGTPEVELFRAVIYSGQGRQRDAERTCARLLAAGQCEPFAHYLLGLFRENERELLRAAWHYREATRLDSRFSLPRLRLGLVLRRSGDEAGALTELALALDLLEREGHDRIVLFGGGFRREVLVELCRAQIEALRAGF
jgi:chemotaxis protein methyltransferase CheR